MSNKKFSTINCVNYPISDQAKPMSLLTKPYFPSSITLNKMVYSGKQNAKGGKQLRDNSEKLQELLWLTSAAG